MGPGPSIGASQPGAATNSSGRVPPAALDLDYEADAATLRAARNDVLAWLSEHGAAETVKERAALIVSELASNAVQASPGDAYTVQVARDDGHYAISVRNRTTANPRSVRARRRPARDVSPRELSLRGRGLAIVDSLSENLSIEREGEELVVRARLRI